MACYVLVQQRLAGTTCGRPEDRVVVWRRLKSLVPADGRLTDVASEASTQRHDDQLRIVIGG